MEAPYVPAKTLEMLAASHPEGARHKAKIDIALPLLGNKFPFAAVVETLRAQFPQASAHECESVVRWCESCNPTPSGYGTQPQANYTRRNGNHNGFTRQAPPEKPLTQEQAVKSLDAQETSEADWTDRSPVLLGEDTNEDATTLLRNLYGPEECVNLVCLHTISDKGKANPSGAGKTQTCAQWLEWFKKKGVPVSAAGAWIRPNPCAPVGSGAQGAIKDADITAHRFLMVESDSLPLPTQLSIYATLELPIAAIILSGGDSAHAWLRIDAKDAAEYEAITTRIYAALTPYGFDAANKNASRLSRLPGVERKIGGKGDCRQRLIYLNPNPNPLNIARLEALAVPAPGLIRGDALVGRIRDFMKPRQSAFTLDLFKGVTPDEGFYFRESEVTVWSGMAGHGKSSMLLSVMINLCVDKLPFFVCSLEYKIEKLLELMARMMRGEQPTSREVESLVNTTGKWFSFADVVGEITPERLLSTMRAANARFGSRHFFIDSLMRISGLEEDYPAQGQFLNALQDVAKSTGGHVNLVAHPRKMDETLRAKKMDVKGSVNIVGNVDNMVTMRRNTAKDEKREKGIITGDEINGMHDAEFAVEKQRETGWQGVVKLMFDTRSRTFTKWKPPERPLRDDPRKKPYNKHD